MSLNLDKSAWKRVAFGDVVQNINDTVRDPESAGIDRIIAMEHLDPGELKISHWGSLDDGTTFTRRVRPGQTLFGKRRAYQRKVAYAEFDAICSGDILTFEADHTQLLPDLLPFLVQSNGFFDHALGTSAGSLSPRTNWRDLANFEFDLPPLDEQQRIADLLWAVEQHQQRLSDCLERIGIVRRRVLFDSLTNGQGSGWPMKPLPELVLEGPRNGRSATANTEGRGIPTLSISAVRGGKVLGGDAVKYIDVDRDSVASFVLEKDDFLVVRGNGNKQLTGLGGLVSDGLPDNCIYPDLLIRLRFDPRVVLPEFAAEQWNASEVHGRLLQNAKSTNGIWKINGKDIKSHCLIVPPIDDQRQIVSELRSVDAAANAVTAELSGLSSMRLAFLAEIFGGN